MGVHFLFNLHLLYSELRELRSRNYSSLAHAIKIKKGADVVSAIAKVKSKPITRAKITNASRLGKQKTLVSGLLSPI
jgi:hypothetical protein